MKACRGMRKLIARSFEGRLGLAEVARQNAQTRLDAGELQRALQELDVAQAECMTARDLAKQAGVAAVAAATRAAGKPGSYMVLRGDTLWGISGSTPIYDNPFTFGTGR